MDFFDKWTVLVSGIGGIVIGGILGKFLVMPYYEEKRKIQKEKDDIFEFLTKLKNEIFPLSCNIYESPLRIIEDLAYHGHLEEVEDELIEFLSEFMEKDLNSQTQKILKKCLKGYKEIKIGIDEEGFKGFLGQFCEKDEKLQILFDDIFRLQEECTSKRAILKAENEVRISLEEVQKIFKKWNLELIEYLLHLSTTYQNDSEEKFEDEKFLKAIQHFSFSKLFEKFFLREKFVECGLEEKGLNEYNRGLKKYLKENIEFRKEWKEIIHHRNVFLMIVLQNQVIDVRQAHEIYQNMYELCSK